MIEATVAIMRLTAGKGLAFLIKVVATSLKRRGTAPAQTSKFAQAPWDGSVVLE